MSTELDGDIVKPVDFARFSEAMREVGLYWLLLNEPPPPLSTPEDLDA